MGDRVRFDGGIDVRDRGLGTLDLGRKLILTRSVAEANGDARADARTGHQSLCWMMRLRWLASSLRFRFPESRDRFSEASGFQWHV
jgi:hypothetical protein